MADGSDKTTEDLEREITCPVCHEHFEDPRTLPCTHYYCKKCVQALADRARTNQSFPCPECRAATYLPQNDANQLPKALPVIRMKDLHQSLVDKKALRCSKHNELLKLYCCDCNCLICCECAVFDHRTHTCKRVSEVTQQFRELLHKKIAPMKATRESYSDATVRAKAMISEIEAQNTDTTGAINQWVERYVEVIRKCGHNLIEEISSTSKRKIENLKVQINGFESVSTVIQSLEEFCEQNIKNATDEEFIASHKNILTRVDDEGKKHKDANLKLAEQCTTLKWTKKLAELCQKKAPTATVVQLTNAMPPTAVGKRAVVPLTILTADRRPYKKPQLVEGEVMSLVDGSLTRIKGTHKKDGTYEMVFTPQIRGRHQLAVTVNGEQVDGSPFTMCVQIPPTQLGTPVRVISGLNRPYGVAINSAEEVLITMTGEIQVFDKRGGKIRTISHIFQFPRGIAVDKEDNVYVADCGYHCVYKLDKDDKQLKAIGRCAHGSDHVQFNNPWGVAVIGEQVFVSDSNNHRIQLFNRELEFLKTIGTHGRGIGQFMNAYDVNLDEVGNLYVCDNGNHRIQVLNSNGEFLNTFGTYGKGKGQLSGPAGVCVSDLFVYVSEFGNDRVSVFDRNGHFLTSFGEGCFVQPLIIRVDKDGFVYICDYHNDRVQIL